MQTAVKITTIISFTLTAGLAAAGIWWVTQLPPAEPLPDISTQTALGVKFINDGENKFIHIELNDTIVATPIHDVRFAESPEQSKLTVIEHDTSDKPLINWSPTYTLLIPSDQLHEISRRFTDAFSENLPLEPETEE